MKKTTKFIESVENNFYVCDKCGDKLKPDEVAYEGIDENGKLIHICIDCEDINKMDKIKEYGPTMLQAHASDSGYDYGRDHVESDDDIILEDNVLFEKFKVAGFKDDSLFKYFKEGYEDYVDSFLEIGHSVDYDSDYYKESKKGELMNKLNEKHFGVEQYFDCANYPNQLMQVAQFIKTCEDEGNIAVLTVQSTDGNVWHTQFTSESWQKFLKGLHGTDEFGRNSGVNTPKDGVAKVWAKDVDPKNSLGESKEIFDNLLGIKLGESDESIYKAHEEFKKDQEQKKEEDDNQENLTFDEGSVDLTIVKESKTDWNKFFDKLMESKVIKESAEDDGAMFVSYINNLFSNDGYVDVGKCPECGMVITSEDELEDGSHECPKCGSILEDHE